MNIFPIKTFKQHLYASVKLGVPLVLMQITLMLINVTDTLMLGWLGVKELAAGTLAFQLVFAVYIFGLGISSALMPLVSSAAGQNDHQAVRRSVRMGLWVLGISVVILMIPMLYGEEILILLGQDSELSALAQTYIIIAQWSLIPVFLLTGLRNFLASLEHTTTILIITILMALLNAILNYAFIFGNFGFPRLEMQGAAIATCIVNVIGFVCLALYVRFSEFCRPYEIFKRFWVPEWGAFKEIIKIGLPISLMIFFEAGMFLAAALMIGLIGEIELAAHGISIQLESLAFMIPLGLSQVASVRVANAAGRGDIVGIDLAAKAVLLLSLGFACITALIFLLIPEILVQLFLGEEETDAQAVIAYATPLLIMAAAFQIFDAIQVSSSGSLRGLKDAKIPMIIAAISYWPIGLTAAYVLAFPLGYGGTGVWGGLVIGLAVSSVCLIWRFTNREKLGLLSLT
ncbi:MAG: MATE family multidrug resistance protein [Cocleimonas sp.]|jgi:MATE family multidrug resistance protein